MAFEFLVPRSTKMGAHPHDSQHPACWNWESFPPGIGVKNSKKRFELPPPVIQFPIASMYGIITYIYHKNQPNVGKYTIHGSYGTGHPVFAWPFFLCISGCFMTPGSLTSDKSSEEDFCCWWTRHSQTPETQKKNTTSHLDSNIIYSNQVPNK